jgi:hypothetical protein
MLAASRSRLVFGGWTCLNSRTRCIVCKQPKKIPAKMQKGVNRLDFERDPFCSTECCERYFGTVVVSASAGSVGPPKMKVA